MKSIVLVMSIAFALISCATPGSQPEPTLPPELPVLDEAMGKVAASLPTQDHQIVAVFSFAERGIGPTLFGEYVAEKLMLALTATREVELVERNRLEAVHQEQKLGATGLIDDATAASIGNIAGAQAAVVGILTNLGNCWELTARLLGTSDARVLAMAEARFSSESVPPNLAGKPVVPSGAPSRAESEAARAKQPAALAKKRPVHHPSQVKAASVHRKPPLHVIFRKCREMSDPSAKRRCFEKLRTLILTGPSTPRKDAARKCLKLPNHRQRILCLEKVIGEPRR